MFGQIYIFDRTTRTEELVSAAPSGVTGNGYSSWPALSADGRYVAFLSEATDPVAGAAPHQVYVCDRLTGTTELIGGVGIPTISGDGRWVAVEGLQPITGNSALFVHRDPL